MSTFLQDVSQYLIEHHPEGMKHVTVVMPGKRAGLFLKDQLKTDLSVSAWLPEMIGINDLITRYSPLTAEDPVDILFKLYAIHCNHSNEPDNLNTFLGWGPTVVSDFDDIDRYLVDPKQIFRNLTEIKELEGWDLDDWSFSNPELKPVQLKFLDFWKQLPLYYTDLNKILEKDGKCRKGWAYRYCAENIDKLVASLKGQTIYFIGLNALSKAEHHIIKNLQKADIGKVMWDMTEDVLKNNVHEAAFFMRQNIKLHGKGVIPFHKAPDSCKVNIYASPNNYSQSGVINKLLKKEDNKHTAVIVCDEKMIEGIQLNLPDLDNSVNITTELPITQTTIHNFLQNLLDINLKQIRKGNNSIYYKDLFDVLQHPAFDWLQDDLKDLVNKAVKTIHEQNLVYLGYSNLHDLFEEHTIFINALLNTSNKLDSTIPFIDLCCMLIERMRKSGPGSDLINEQLYQELSLQRKLKEIILKQKTPVDLIAYQQVMRHVLSAYKLSFVGEPLNGVQIMGMLESRSLNFDKIVIVGANEGNLPDNTALKTFIPFDLRAYFKLPGKKNKEAIHAYYFYRQLWRAKDIHIVYNADLSSFDAKEPSRYIYQLRYNKTLFNVAEHLPGLDTSALRAPLHVNKTGNLKAALANYFKQGLSPSSIGQYLNCELNFFHRNVLRLYEQNDIEESVQDNTFGTIIHDTLETFYHTKSAIGRPLVTNDYKNLTPTIETILKPQYEKHFHKDRVFKGRNKIAYRVSLHYISQFLRNELGLIKKGNTIEIIALEQKMLQSLKLSDGWWLPEVSIKGTIDRIEKYNGVFRILDYKTGSSSTIGAKYFEQVFTDQDKAKELQLLIYAWLYHKSSGKSGFQTGIIYTRSPEWPDIYKREFTSDFFEEIESNLVSLIEKMTHLDVPFTEKFSPKYDTLLGYPQ